MSDEVKRYQVFVSSTYLDLKNERQAVIAALLESDAFPAGMEMFPAADDDAWTLIRKVIDDSDYYLLVIGGKYGSVDPIEEISFTEKEYDYAVKKGKPVMAFLFGDPGKLTFERSEPTEERQAQLQAFREKVEGAKHVKHWDSADGLAGQVALSFNRFVRLYPAVGWIRADVPSGRQTLQELADSRRRISELEEEIDQIRTTPPEGTEGLAQGDEQFVLPMYVTTTFAGESTSDHDFHFWHRRRLSWNRAFAIVCPELLQEASEPQIRLAFQKQLVIDFSPSLNSDAKRQFKSQGGDPTEFDSFYSSVGIDDEDFGTLILQFDALGLIQPSSRKRSVSDHENYWSLTPYGKTRAIQIRALQTDEPLPGAEGKTESDLSDESTADASA